MTLAKALYATGDDHRAAVAWREASDTIKAYAANLKPEHARTFLEAEPVREVIKTAGSN